MCGENYLPATPDTARAGSPPHVRGKLSRILNQVAILRITPACAGKTLKLPRCHHQTRDHPRMCGENEIRIRRNYNGWGSPPHVRGKPVVRLEIELSPGITPACAGKTGSTFRNRIVARDHPRMCGENVFLCGINVIKAGSPPHVRGKQMQRSGKPVREGITPACAGKTLKNPYPINVCQSLRSLFL